MLSLLGIPRSTFGFSTYGTDVLSQDLESLSLFLALFEDLNHHLWPEIKLSDPRLKKDNEPWWTVAIPVSSPTPCSTQNGSSQSEEYRPVATDTSEHAGFATVVLIRPSAVEWVL